MIETTDGQAHPDEGRQAFLRYLPKRIAAFEHRILRYRFEGWEPSGMMVLGGDLQRLADASSRYDLVDTRAHLLTLAQLVRDFVANLRAPDPQQTKRLFALLAAVIKSLPPATEPLLVSATFVMPQATGEQHAETAALGVDPTPSDVPEAIAPEPDATFESVGSAEPVEPTATIETAEPVESPATVDAAEPVESPATIETAGSVEVFEPGAAIEAAELHEPIESEATIEAAGSLAASDTVDPAVPGAPLDEAAPVDAIAAVESAGSIEPDAPNEPVAPAAHAESIAAAEPVDQAPQAEPVEPSEADEPDEPDTIGATGIRRIYHLSDGNAFALELERRLESEGYAIEPVESLDELSELLMCLLPQVLLVDASHLPELADINRVRGDAQKRSQPPRRIQMVVMAPQDNLETRRAAHRAGVDLLLAPPFDIDGISDRLKSMHASAAEQKVRVLIVEDDRSDALYAQTVLSNAGMQVQVEHDPMRVLETLNALRPDLVLMDLHMPFANGVEVTMVIREHPVFARLPIVFLSGESDPDSRLEAINAGGDDFLFKPIRPRHLIAAVRDRMRRMHPIGAQGAAMGAPEGRSV
jgi:DNA-binding response OmpR family regulator